MSGLRDLGIQHALTRAGLFCLVLALTWIPARGQEVRSWFEEGNSLYRDGRFEEALDAYSAILESGWENGEVYFNIGNCQFKLGNLGRAILNYERALNRLPADEDVLANLQLTYSMTRDDITPLPRFWLLRLLDWWVLLFPAGTLRVLTAAFYLLMAGALVLRILDRQGRSAGLTRAVATFSALLFVLFGLSLMARELGPGRTQQGVVLLDQVPVMSAPGQDRELEVFTIHEGTKFRIDQQSGDWAEIVLLDGKVGWIKSDAFEVI